MYCDSRSEVNMHCICTTVIHYNVLVLSINELQIYFSELKYTYTESRASYSMFSLLCDVGGALGLILGSTVLTFFEVADLALTLVVQAVDRNEKDRSLDRSKTRHSAQVVPATNSE